MYENFISVDDAHALTSFITDNKDKFEYFPPDKRYRLVNEDIPLVVSLVNTYGEKFQSMVSPTKKTEVSDYVLSIYEPSAFMNIHSDNTMPEHGNCNFTGVIYLNDDYEGGEIFFPEKYVKLKPKALSAVAFNGDYYHGVRPVLSGIRYILAIGFTDDIDFFVGGKNRKHLLG